MLNICVCDDNYLMRKKISELIKEIGIKNNLPFQIFEYGSGEEMLFDLSENDKYIDIFFLDILMKKLNGIETASELRKLNSSSQIIFLTVSKEHVFVALDVMPLHYLVKQDVSPQKIEKVLLKAVSLSEKKQQEIFAYKFGKVVGSVPLKDIIYFEVKNRIVEMHLKNNKILEFYANLSDVEQQLCSDVFERVHRSFVVNFENMDSLSGKEFVAIDGTVIPIGQRYIDAKERYQKFLVSTMHIV